MTITPRTGSLASRERSGRQVAHGGLPVHLHQVVEARAADEAEGNAECVAKLVRRGRRGRRGGGKVEPDESLPSLGGQEPAARMETHGGVGGEMPSSQNTCALASVA